MKDKQYPAGCEVHVGGLKYRPIIVITHDECIFSANDGKQKAWGTENQIFLRPKGKGRGIMVSDFLLPWSRLNLLSLPRARQEELQSLGIPLEAAVLYEYGKEEGYWDGKMLLEQAQVRLIISADFHGSEYEYKIFSWINYNIISAPLRIYHSFYYSIAHPVNVPLPNLGSHY